MPLIATARGSMWYADHHKAHGKPLLLIHGAAGTHLDWPMQLRKMNSLGPDLIGHGKSPAAARATVEENAEDLVALLDALHIEQAVLAGYSMGGAIAQTIALNYPQRVGALVLMNTASRFRVNRQILNVTAQTQDEIGQNFKQWMWHPDTPQGIRELGYQQFMKTPPEVIRADYGSCARWDITQQVSEIRAPTLIFGAPADKMVPFAETEALANLIPNAKLVRVENAGHMMQLEQAAFISEQMQTWLAGL